MLSRTFRVLIVDDSVAMRKIVRAFLAELGTLAEREAVHGQHAIDLMRTWTPQLIISDVQMTPVDGHRLLTHVRGARALARIPFIMMTGHAVRFAECGREGGLTQYLAKPFKAADLAARIEAALVATRRLAA